MVSWVFHNCVQRVRFHLVSIVTWLDNWATGEKCNHHLRSLSAVFRNACTDVGEFDRRSPRRCQFLLSIVFWLYKTRWVTSFTRHQAWIWSILWFVLRTINHVFSLWFFLSYDSMCFFSTILSSIQSDLVHWTDLIERPSNVTFELFTEKWEVDQQLLIRPMKLIRHGRVASQIQFNLSSPQWANLSHEPRAVLYPWT